MKIVLEMRTAVVAFVIDKNNLIFSSLNDTNGNINYCLTKTSDIFFTLLVSILNTIDNDNNN